METLLDLRRRAKSINIDLMKNRLAVLAFLFILMNGKAQFSICEDYNKKPELQSSLCATLNVPLEYGTDMDETIELFVRKFPAKQEKKGSIWLVAGGPGESGASLYPLIGQFAELFPHLDIFVPDHRGTGLSGKICPVEEGVDSPDGIALSNAEWGPCFGYMFSHAEYVKSFSISNAARDLDYLINQLSGSGSRYVYGVSYGTQLVLRMLQIHSSTLDGVILDSLVPLQDNQEHDLSQRSSVVNDIGVQVLNRLESNKSTIDLPLLDQLKLVLERSKSDDIFLKNLPNQELSQLFGMMLDIPMIRKEIPHIIRSLSKNDFGPLQKGIEDMTQFYSDYGSKYVTSANSIPLAQIITASENNLRTQMKKEEVIEESKTLLFTSPLPKLIAENAMPTYSRDIYFAGVPDKIPPTLVIHGTLDPKTHLNGAIQHVEKLSTTNKINFVEVQDAPHFIALFAPDAFAEAVNLFINGEPLPKRLHDKNVSLN
jgi:Predicted hydrolases or acyltransferases (alpha/beta hydrolase superfamily)